MLYMQLLPAPGPASSAHPVPHVDESHPASGGRAKKIFNTQICTFYEQKSNKKKTEKRQKEYSLSAHYAWLINKKRTG